MSGPITVLLCPAQALPVLLAASAIRAARAVCEAQAEALEQRARNADHARDAARQQTAAAQSGMAALQAQADAAEQRLAQLDQLVERLGGGAALQQAGPQRPQQADYVALAEYVRTLEAFGVEAQQVLATTVASRPPGGDDKLAHIVLPAAAMADDAAPSARLVQRIAHLGALPVGIAAVAAELDAAPDDARAELLASELRRRVQLHAEAALAEQVQQAQALVVEQSLQDLGYQVEGIASTLFVEGGVAHFRKQHWGDYMVRLRVNAGERSINFNVVRAVDDASADTSASVQDHLAEDRWCAEFPALLDALAARGVELQVTRRLEAGELPVQRVDRAQLPQFTDTDAHRTTRARPPLARPLP